MRILRTVVLSVGLAAFASACGGSDKKEAKEPMAAPAGTDEMEQKADDTMNAAGDEMMDKKDDMEKKADDMEKKADDAMDGDKNPCGGGW